MVKRLMVIVFMTFATGSVAEAACQIWNSSTFNRYIRQKIANDERGDADANCKLPFALMFSELSAARASIACGSGGGKPNGRQVETTFSSIDENISELRKSQEYCSMSKKTCFTSHLTENRSCNSAGAVAVDIYNDCGTTIRVYACIKRQSQKPACGLYTVEDKSTVTHYTCSGLPEFSVSRR